MMINCDYCGIEFNKKPCHVKVSAHHFCSRKCNDEWRKAQTEKFCQYCGERIKRRPDGRRTSNKKYCSIKCQGLALRKQVKFRCEICGKESTLPQSHFDRCKYHTCSKKCAATLHSIRMTGTGNSNYKGSQIVRDDVIRKRLRRAARKRDKETCRMCGAKSNLEVHHIIPFILIEEKGGLDNLITLCHSCHKQVHQILRDSEEMYEELFNLNGASETSQISAENLSLEGAVRSYNSRDRRRKDILSANLAIK